MSSTIKQLKEKLLLIEATFQEKVKEVQIRDQKENQIKTKLDDIIKNQKEITKFNIGGEYINIRNAVFMNCRYDNILKDIFLNAQQNNNIEEIQNIFIDKSSRIFIYIIEIMLRSINSANEFHLRLPKEISTENFKNEIIYYFKKDSDRVFEDFKIIGLSYDNTKIELVSPSNMAIINHQSTTIVENDNLSNFKATNVNQIRTTNSQKAFFVNNNGAIIFELKGESKISSLEIKPFTSDTNLWNPTQGSGSFVFVSTDNNKWDFTVAIPEDYGKNGEQVSIAIFDAKAAKYIKIQTGETSISISYLKIS